MPARPRALRREFSDASVRLPGAARVRVPALRRLAPHVAAEAAALAGPVGLPARGDRAVDQLAQRVAVYVKRLDDLDAIVDQLRGAGETVEINPERYPNGRFAELRDPEGNGIQLWQPMDPE